MNCTICNGPVRSLTSVGPKVGKVYGKRIGVVNYRWCPKDDRIFTLILGIGKNKGHWLRLLL